MSNKLQAQLQDFMHDMISVNQSIMNENSYLQLSSLCEQDIRILDLVCQNSNLTAKEISTRLAVPKTTIVTAVSRLASRGYLERVQNEQDKRELYLVLTEKGKQANEEHLDYENRILQKIADMWDKEDQKKLTKLLKRRGGTP